MIRLRRPAVAALALVLAACAPRISLPAPYPPPPPAEPAELRAYERTIVQLINEDRRVLGLDTLWVEPNLNAIALLHSTSMAAGHVEFGHDGFEQRGNDAFRDLGVTHFAENVATNNFRLPSSPHRAVQGWLGSPPHRQNIEGAYTLTGVGVAQSEDGHFFVTQVFARP